MAKAQGRPYVIVFVGVNGVGKSTSLAKVCYYLKSQGCKMLIAACDTFRSGAVEQLRTHCDCLGVDLFERGYAKDPAQVAGAGVKHAQDNGYDCLLIDTAGRMQNNEPLMRALAKLVSQNPIDLTLFVGEALVGNDGIDQLNLFNKVGTFCSQYVSPRAPSLTICSRSFSRMKTGVDRLRLTRPHYRRHRADQVRHDRR
jgi:signal recognition particle receptor subunit alpha